MKRITQAPNLVLATLWADLLRQGGFDVSVQRAYASSIAGEIPPDQALPEVWIADDEQLDAARDAAAPVAPSAVPALGVQRLRRADRGRVHAVLEMRRHETG